MITQNNTGKHLPLFSRTPSDLKEKQTDQPNSSHTPTNQSDAPNSPNNTTRTRLPITDINKAIQHFENQLNQYPDYKPFRNVVLTILANLHQKTNNISKAIECTEQSSSGPDKLIESLEKLAQNCLTTNNPSGAIQSYEHILTLPQLPLDKQIEILKNLKDIYLNDSNYTQNTPQLIKCYERIANLPGVSTDHKIYALSNIGCIYHETQHHATAVTYYERVLTLPDIQKDDQYTALLTLAELHHKLGNLDKQIESYERIFTLSDITHRIQDLSTLAQLYRKKGTTTKAIEFLEHQLNHSDQPPIPILTQLVELHEETNNIPAQIKYLNILTSSNDLSPHQHQTILHKLRDLYLKTDDTTLLISTLTQLAETGKPHHYEEILNLPDISPTQRYNALLALANIPTSNPQDKTQYHERILLIPNLPTLLKINSLKTLTSLYKASRFIDLEITSHQSLLSITEISPDERHDSLTRLAELFRAKSDILNEAKTLESILLLPNLASSLVLKSLDRLSTLYTQHTLKRNSYQRIFELKSELWTEEKLHALHNWLNLTVQLNISLSLPEISNILNLLRNIYTDNNFSLYHHSLFFSNDFQASNCSNIKQKCYKLILQLPDLSHDSLDKIADFFGEIGNTHKQIKSYQLILQTPQLPPHQQLKTLQKLAYIYSHIKSETEQTIKYSNLILSSPIATSKDQYDALLLLASAYRNSNKHDKAIQSYERILQTLSPSPDSQYLVLSNLAKTHCETRRPHKAIKYYELIIQKTNINPHNILQALIDLIQLCKKIDNVDKEIWCHEQILSSPQSSPEIHIDSLYSLLNIYDQLDDTNKIIQGYNRTLNLQKIIPTPFIHYKILKELSKIYASTKNTSKEIECLESILSLPKVQDNYMRYADYIQTKHAKAIQSLIDIYNKFDNQTQTDGYERILKLPNLTPEVELISIRLLIPLYSKSQNSSKQTEYIERIIKHPKAKLNQKYNLLIQLAELYSESNDIPTSIHYYEKILYLSNLNLHQKIGTLDALAKLYNTAKDNTNEKIALYELIALHRTLNNTNSEIECLERILLISDPFSPPHITVRLAHLYQENNNHHKAISYYSLYLKTSPPDQASKCNATEQLAKLYMKIKNFTQALIFYEYLLIYLKSLSLRENRKNEHKPDIFQKADNYDKRIDCYKQLAKIYEKFSNTPKQIECYSTILDFPNINWEYKIDILKKLIPLYLNLNDFPKAKECEFEILKLNPNLHIETLLFFLNHPTSGLPFNAKALINKKPRTEKNIILHLLASYHWLWSDVKGKPQKLTKHQWTTVLTCPDTPGELERLALQPCFTTQGLNHKLFFNDPTMPKWNILVQRKTNITNNDWEIIESDLLKIFDTIHTPNNPQRKYLSKFLSQCMESKGAQNPAGKQLLRKRITACIDFLTDLQTSKPFDLSTIKFLQNSLATMIVGGTACPDRAIVFLTTLETNIKLFINPNFLPNIIAHKYKFEAITQTLVPEINDPIEVDSKGIPIIKENENLETLFYYTRKLNTPLGLGLDNSTQILYAYLAKTVPLELTIEPLSAAFTQEKLLNFTIQDPSFISKFEPTKDTAIPPEKHQEYIDAINDHSDAIGTPEENDKNIRISQIQAEIKLLEKNYLLNEAKKMYIESGLISS